MKIDYLLMEGFRGVRDKLEIRFPRGFLVIAGSNGAGKSTICDAIEFALTGGIARHRDHKESGETFQDYLWWRGSIRPQNRYVELGITTERGEPFVIRRDASNRPDPARDLNLGRLCEGVAGGGIENLCQTTIIRGEQLAELSLDLAETERFNFVKAALGTSDLSHLEQKASEASKRFKDRASQSEPEYQRLRGTVAQIVAEISAATAQILESGDLSAAEDALRQALGQNSLNVSQLVAIARTEIISLRERISSLQEIPRRLTELERDLREVETPTYQQQLESIAERLSALRPKLSQAQASSADLEEKIGRQQQNQSGLESLIQLHHHGSILGLKNGHCPLCALAISEEEFNSNLVKLKTEVDQQNDALGLLLRERASLSEELRKITNEVQSLERQQRDLDARSRALKEEQIRLNETVSRLIPPSERTEPMTFSTVQGIVGLDRQRLSILEKQLAVLESSRTVERASQLGRQLEEVRQQSNAVDAKITRNKSLSDKLREVASVIKRVSGEMVDDRLAELSPLLSELYSRLRPHTDWADLSYLIRGDVRRFLSLRIGDDLNPRFMFSNGQRRAVGLAFLLSVHLSRPWCKLRSLILDDPVQHIDDFRALHLVEVLSAIRRSGRQIVCTIEDDALAKLLCRRLRSADGEEGSLVEMSYSPNEGSRVATIHKIPSLPKVAIMAA